MPGKLNIPFVTFEGVEDVKADCNTGKLMVKGNVDPYRLWEMVKRKTKMKVELLSAQPKHDGGSGSGEDKKPKKVVQAQYNTEAIRVHCDSSATKVKRFIMKALTPYLKDKLKRKVEGIPPKKYDGSGVRGDNKKEKEVVGRGGSDRSDGGIKIDGELKVSIKRTKPKEKKAEVMNKVECYNGCNDRNTTMVAMPRIYNQSYSNQDYGVTMHDHGYYGHSTGDVSPCFNTSPRCYGHRIDYVSPRHFSTTSDDDDHHDHGHTSYASPWHFSTTSDDDDDDDDHHHDHGHGHTGYVSPQHFAIANNHGHGHTGYVSPKHFATTSDHGHGLRNIFKISRGCANYYEKVDLRYERIERISYRRQTCVLIDSNSSYSWK